MGTRALRHWVALCIGLSTFGAASTAAAGGLFFTDRGVRPMGRGFAFVAGADDPHAIWYNPANLRFSGQQLLLDANLLFFRGSYRRVDSGGTELPAVDVDVPRLPLPTLAYTHRAGDFGFGLGVGVPHALLLRWPRGITATGSRCDPERADCAPAPTRYSLLSLDGSALILLSPAMSYEPTPGLHFGLGMHLLVGRFVGETAVSGCDGFVCTQPENPDWDGVARFTLAPLAEPGLSAGITYDANHVRVSASLLWWPSAVSGNAKLDVRLPSAPLFDDAEVEGRSARLRLQLPLTLRAGVEVRPLPSLRIEAALVWERWSEQRSALIESRGVTIRNVAGIGDYEVGDIRIPRNMNNVLSARLGGAFGTLEERLWVRAGLSYETSSFDDAYLTPLTLDSSKVILGFGASYEVKSGLWLEVSYAHVFVRDRDVQNSQVPQPSALRPPRNPDVPPSAGGVAYVGNGTYTMEADLLGIGMRYQWRPAGSDPPPENEGEPEAGGSLSP